MKKSALIFSSLIMSVLSINLVSAALPAPPITMNELTNFFTSIFIGTSAFGGIGADVFARFLLVILMITILAKPAQLITKERNTALIVAVIVSILGIRFLTPEMISGVLLPYGTVAIVVSTFIPFFLLAYFLQQIEFNWIRKIGWIMSAVVFIGLWWMRWTDIGNMAYIYLIVSILSIIFFLFDGTIQNWFTAQKMKGRLDMEGHIEVVRLERQLDEYIQLLGSAKPGSSGEKAIKESIDDTKKKIITVLKTSK